MSKLIPTLFVEQPRLFGACPKLHSRYMTIDKVPDCIGVMKFERMKDEDENETKEVDM